MPSKAPPAKDKKGNALPAPKASSVMQVPVLLNVYDLGESSTLKKINSLSSLVGGGVFHAGVEVFGTEWSYGFTDCPGSGVNSCLPRLHPGHTYKCTVHMGESKLSKASIEQLLGRMADEWQGEDYHLTNQNCLEFCTTLTQALGVGKIPSWVDRYGRTAKTFTQDKAKSPKRTSAAPNSFATGFGLGKANAPGNQPLGLRKSINTGLNSFESEGQAFNQQMGLRRSQIGLGGGLKSGRALEEMMDFEVVASKPLPLGRATGERRDSLSTHIEGFAASPPPAKAAPKAANAAAKAASAVPKAAGAVPKAAGAAAAAGAAGQAKAKPKPKPKSRPGSTDAARKEGAAPKAAAKPAAPAATEADGAVAAPKPEGAPQAKPKPKPKPKAPAVDAAASAPSGYPSGGTAADVAESGAVAEQVANAMSAEDSRKPPGGSTPVPTAKSRASSKPKAKAKRSPSQAPPRGTTGADKAKPGTEASQLETGGEVSKAPAAAAAAGTKAGETAAEGPAAAKAAAAPAQAVAKSVPKAKAAPRITTPAPPEKANEIPEASTPSTACNTPPSSDAGSLEGSAPLVKSRDDVLQTLFNRYDADKDQLLSETEMRPVAVAFGFEGGDTEWKEWFADASIEIGAVASVGLNLAQFKDLLADASVDALEKYCAN
eukprot:TRINITY_DN1398_c1_g1_i1.p1 TRINITY_DN1398_c1_g1~~TRINITY_DN1398_c1_g1_i1.p1  ORF type:complete len:658 (-),score=160.71 TRINITY_DN1398_c1_g1_i1:53-2026(-)